ncbi:MAG: hypothetical protein MN733_34975 [Nitrososphaera sp.]|nr:hypothetical protein [Nitrososphaera sp.]
MKDPANLRLDALNHVLELTSSQLQECERSVEEIKSLMHWSRTPRERTMMNIVLDDQKKVARALERLVSDIADVIDDSR